MTVLMFGSVVLSIEGWPAIGMVLARSLLFACFSIGALALLSMERHIVRRHRYQEAHLEFTRLSEGQLINGEGTPRFSGELRVRCVEGLAERRGSWRSWRLRV